MTLVTELKRRNVFRVALFYIVSAWLVVQTRAQHCVARVSAKRAPGDSGPITHLPRMRPQALSGLRKPELPGL